VDRRLTLPSGPVHDSAVAGAVGGAAGVYRQAPSIAPPGHSM